MTDVTPPPELVKQWATASPVQSNDENWAYEFFIAHHAAQWGADQELEACVKLLELSDKNARDFLYSARRPKPPSLKERALLAIDIAVADDRLSADVANVVRRALEQLPE
jgi:hypothetical protein